jgi:serine/threonine protein kinase
LADFGLSNVFAAGKPSLMYTDCGTPAYQYVTNLIHLLVSIVNDPHFVIFVINRAPEMTGSGYDAAAVDVWAAGVVLFLMIAGFPPYMQQGDWWHNKLTTNRLHLFWAAHVRNAAFSEPIKVLTLFLPSSHSILCHYGLSFGGCDVFVTTGFNWSHVMC